MCWVAVQVELYLQRQCMTGSVTWAHLHVCPWALNPLHKDVWFKLQVEFEVSLICLGGIRIRCFPWEVFLAWVFSECIRMSVWHGQVSTSLGPQGGDGVSCHPAGEQASSQFPWSHSSAAQWPQRICRSHLLGNIAQNLLCSWCFLHPWPFLNIRHLACPGTQINPFPHFVHCLFSHPRPLNFNWEPSVQRQCRLFLICGTVWTLIRTDNKEHKPIGTLSWWYHWGMLAWWQLSCCSVYKKLILVSEYVEEIGNISVIPKCVHLCEQKLPSWLLCADEMGTLVIYGQNKGSSICVVVVQCSKCLGSPNTAGGMVTRGAKLGWLGM